MKLFLLFIYMTLTTFLFADNDVNYCSDCSCVSISRNFFNDEIIGFYLSSIDLESGESSTLLFDYSIDLTEAIRSQGCNPIGPCPEIMTDEVCQEQWYDSDLVMDTDPTTQHGIDELYLDFDISMYIPDLMEANEELVSGRVRFDLNSPVVQEINFRNTDLNFNTTQLAGNTLFNLESYDLKIADSTIDEITNLFLSQGRAPNGVYTFNFAIGNGSDTYDSLTEVVEVFVPSFLDLISPGTSEVSDSLSNIVMTSNPIFQWNSDYCNKCDFNIRVSEFKPSVHNSMQEALDDYSVLPLNDGFYNVPGTVNSFQYPNSNVGELTPGKLYVWQLMRSYTTSNGTNEEFSPIYLFKMKSIELENSQIVDTDINLENIKLLIGSDIYDNLFKEGGPLNLYDNVGGTISIDNNNYSINYLIDMINKKNQGKITIIEVDVE